MSGDAKPGTGIWQPDEKSEMLSGFPKIETPGQISLEEASRRAAERLRNMTDEQRFETFVSAGILLPSGELAPEYRPPTDRTPATISDNSE